MKKRLPKWRFFLSAAVCIVPALSYLLSREWSLAFAWLGIGGFWAVVGWAYWLKQEINLAAADIGEPQESSQA